ncbi:peptidoglycan recognition protein family protein [Streptomyces syringium]|uniref:peptidoglycan recognition protein family protein n=1 Tax=Streptomyces syringium TaxID=76729 RepID=UPI0033ADE51F
MRGIFVTSTVTACAAALTLPLLTTPTGAATAPAARIVPAADLSGVPGSTRSLPLVPLTGGGPRSAEPPRGSSTAERGLPPREVEPFSLVGIVWDNAAAELRGQAQVRTRAVGSHRWSAWQDVQIHDDDRPDLDSAEGASGRRRGATAPLWVGASDAVQVRVRAETVTDRTPEGPAFPSGLRLELVDPGKDPAPEPVRPQGQAPSVPAAVPAAVPARAAEEPTVSASAAPSDEEIATSAVNTLLAPLGAAEIPARDKDGSGADVAATGPGDAPVKSPPQDPDTDGAADVDTTDDGADAAADDATDGADQGSRYVEGGSYIGPRPRIVTRAGWGADESIRERGFVYTKTVRAAFVHHTASGNKYSCSQSASVIRGIYRYHVQSSGWRDMGYNFLVDKCGTIYEGRSGGVAKAVMGAHTLGFNSNSMGIAVLGTFGSSTPPTAAVDAVARLTAWKLGLFGRNPLGSTTLVSAGGNLFKKGTKVRLKVISGHRDGYATECPGDLLYKKLGRARSTAARLQGR